MLSDTYAPRLPHPSLIRRPNTLLGGTLTLFALKNSLFARPGNFPAKSLADRLFCGLRHANSVGNRQNSLFLPTPNSLLSRAETGSLVTASSSGEEGVVEGL